MISHLTCSYEILSCSHYPIFPKIRPSENLRFSHKQIIRHLENRMVTISVRVFIKPCKFSAQCLDFRFQYQCGSFVVILLLLFTGTDCVDLIPGFCEFENKTCIQFIIHTCQTSVAHFSLFQVDWTRDPLEKFLELWAVYPCLYDNKNRFYSNKQHPRQDALNKITRTLQEDGARLITIEDIKKKMNNRCSQYNHELHKIRRTGSSGSGTDEMYEPV